MPIAVLVLIVLLVIAVGVFGWDMRLLARVLDWLEAAVAAAARRLRRQDRE